MKNKLVLVLVSLIVSYACSVNVSGRVYETIVRVGLFSNAKKIHIKSHGDFRVVDVFSLDKEKLKSDTDYIVTASGQDLLVGSKRFSKQIRFIPNKRDEFLMVNGRRYRDTILILLKDGGNLTAINELGIDGYLFGVLPVEVSPKWPIEALKAQAIVSRTYVINNIGKYDSQGYDMSSDIFSQVYRGVEVENAMTNKAVNDTSGVVLTYKGSLAKAFFHSSCGGHTESVKEVWGNSIEYLKGVVCGYCKDSPRYHWNIDIAPGIIKDKINKKGYKIGNIHDIKLLSRTGSGRIGDMYILHKQGKLLISGHKFRMAVGPDLLKSVLFAIERSAPQYRFYGRGWGHAVGMCQWGAKGLSETGRSCKYILRFYFPGTRIEQWKY
ncbi:SpoIID/LytB domain-containing protein [Elusimicrobiota bacterium]